jgi:hypothetical protein
MTGRILDLAGANALMLLLGVGLLPPLRLVRTRRELLGRLPLAYAVGLAATGILAADLAVVDVPVGWILLAAVAVVVAAVGLRRLPGGGPLRLPRPAWAAAPAYAVLGVVVAFGVPLAKLLAVNPLNAIDGWVIWGLRARALYDFGHPVAPVFTDPAYQALQHPLLLPALEALDFRVMGGFDGTLVHLQLLGFAIAFVGGAWGLLRTRVPPLLRAAVLLAAVTAPTFLNQLPSNYADMPLAIFVALGLAALATDQLPAAALFLGAGALTKNEGEVFALTAFIAAALVARRARLRPLALAAVAVFAVDLPWRIWIWAHHVKIAEYSISNLFSPSYLWAARGRVGPSAHELVHQIWRLESFSFVVPLVLAGFAGAVVLRRFRMAAFGAVWLALSFAGLLAIYWISTNPIKSHLTDSADRTIDSLVFGGLLLVPLLLAVEREPEARELARNGDGRLDVEDLRDLRVLPDQVAGT